MAKASVKCVCAECGCAYTWTKTCYNRREADSWEAWAAGEEHLCPECYRKSLHEAATKAGAEQADKDGLPALAGSEKQIAWAEAIRGEAVAAWDRCAVKAEIRPLLIECVAAHTDAHWWIENRFEVVNVFSSNPLVEELSAKIKE